MTETPPKKTSRDPAVRFIIILGVIVLSIGLISLFFELLGTWFYVSVFLTILVAAGLFWGNRLYGGGTGTSPTLGMVVILCSCLCVFLDVMSTNKMFGGPLVTFSWVLAVTAVICFILAYVMDVEIILVTAILFLVSWAAYIGGGFWGWLPFFRGGMNSHTYVALVSPLIVLSGFIHERFLVKTKGHFSAFPQIYYFLGFLFLNISLWMLSLFGRQARLFGGVSESSEIVLFTILFFAANVFAIVFGGMTGRRSLITLGVIFLTVNILTRFGDVLIPGLGKSATFIIAGAVVIALGLVLEGMLKKK